MLHTISVFSAGHPSWSKLPNIGGPLGSVLGPFFPTHSFGVPSSSLTLNTIDMLTTRKHVLPALTASRPQISLSSSLWSLSTWTCTRHLKSNMSNSEFWFSHPIWTHILYFFPSYTSHLLPQQVLHLLSSKTIPPFLTICTACTLISVFSCNSIRFPLFVLLSPYSHLRAAREIISKYKSDHSLPLHKILEWLLIT